MEFKWIRNQIEQHGITKFIYLFLLNCFTRSLSGLNYRFKFWQKHPRPSYYRGNRNATLLHIKTHQVQMAAYFSTQKSGPVRFYLHAVFRSDCLPFNDEICYGLLYKNICFFISIRLDLKISFIDILLTRFLPTAYYEIIRPMRLDFHWTRRRRNVWIVSSKHLQILYLGEKIELEKYEIALWKKCLCICLMNDWIT